MSHKYVDVRGIIENRTGRTVAETTAAPNQLRRGDFALAKANYDTLGDSSPTPWSKDHPCCRSCGRTSVKHAGHGLCRTCKSYAYMERHPASAERIDRWHREHPDRVAAIKRRHKERIEAQRGVSHSARFWVGKVVSVVANGAWQAAEVRSLAYRRGTRWLVDVRLPWGEIVTFGTKEVRL